MVYQLSRSTLLCHDIPHRGDIYIDIYVYEVPSISFNNCEHVNDLRPSLFHLLNYLITTVSELREKPKVTGSKVWTIGRLRNKIVCDMDQIVCDKDGVVDWYIILEEMPLT